VNIVVVNHSKLLSADELARVVAACNVQLQVHVNPAWDTEAVVTCPALPSSVGATQLLAETAPADRLMVLADTADVADALGYHTLDANGHPVGFVFAKTCQDAGEDWRVTLSHEVVEMAVDPWISACAVHSPAKSGASKRPNLEVWPQEACDAVQGDSYPAPGTSVHVSNFVLPAFFRDGSKGPWDFMNVLKGPFTLAKGGYTALLRGSRWTQVFGALAPESKRKTNQHARRQRLAGL
jgi:hypothetical protein